MEIDCAAILPAPGTTSGHVTQFPASLQTSERQFQMSDDWGSSKCSKNGLSERPPVEISEVVYPHLWQLQQRRATFLTWPFPEHFPPDTLAMQGFYYAGYADCIRCFYCGVGLKSWAANDDVMIEHIRRRPSCGFLLNTKGRQFIRGVLSRLQSEDENNSSADREPEERGGEPDSPRPGQWNRQLHEMGFTQASVTHAMQHLQHSGAPIMDIDAVVNAILELESRDSTPANSRNNNSEHTARAPDGNQAGGDQEEEERSAERARRLRAENSRLRAARTCRLCLWATVDLMFLPCGHLLTCTGCGSTSTQCLACHKPISATTKVYLT